MSEHKEVFVDSLSDTQTQSMNQPVKQSVDQSIDQPMNQSINQPVKQQISKPIKRRSSKRKHHGCMKKDSPFHIAPLNLTTHSPSLIDGINFKDETVMRAETADFISQMGQVCKISQWTIATAAVYMHAFYSHMSFARFDRFELAATCLFLAGKVEERKIRVDQVIVAYYTVRLNHISHDKKVRPSTNQAVREDAHFGLNIPHPASDEWEAFRQRIYVLEYAVLDCVEFDFDLIHPYQNVMTFLKDVVYGPNYANMPADLLKKEMSQKGGLAQIAWLFINDSFRSTLCLRYPPDMICVGVISLAIKYRKFVEPRRFGQPLEQRSRPWFEDLFGLDLAAIVDIEKTVTESANQSYVPDYPSALQLVRAQNLSPMPSLPAPRIVHPVSSSQAVAPNSNKKWHPRGSKRVRNSSSAVKTDVQPMSQQMSQALKDSAANCDDWDNELAPAAPTRTATPSSPSPVRPTNMSPLSCHASPSVLNQLSQNDKQGNDTHSPNSNQSRKRSFSPYHPTNESNIQSIDQFEFQSSQTKIAVSLMPRFNLSESHTINPPLSQATNPSIDYSIEPTECSDWEEDDVRPSPKCPVLIRPHREDLDDPLEDLMRDPNAFTAAVLSQPINQSVRPRILSSLNHIQSELAQQMSASFRTGQCNDRSRLHKRQRFADESSSSPVTFC